MTVGHDRARREPWIFRGYSAESLGALRISLAAGYLLFQITQFYPFLELKAAPSWVLLEPIWYLELLGIERLHPPVTWALFALSLGATVALMLGRYTRTSIVVVLTTMMLLKGYRDGVVGDTHHRLIMWWMLFFFLFLSESHRAFSLDARRAPPTAALEEWRASWPIRAMQLYVASFYLWSAVSKLRASGWAWIDDGGKLREVLLLRSAMWGFSEDGEPIRNQLAFTLAQNPRLLEVLGVGALAMELVFPAILFVRSTRGRVIFLTVVTVFHVMNFALLYVGFVLMPLAFVIFFDLAPVAARVRARFGRGVEARGADPASVESGAGGVALR